MLLLGASFPGPFWPESGGRDCCLFWSLLLPVVVGAPLSGLIRDVQCKNDGQSDLLCARFE